MLEGSILVRVGRPDGNSNRMVRNNNWKHIMFYLKPYLIFVSFKHGQDIPNILLKST